jgi:hypothetical protein
LILNVNNNSYALGKIFPAPACFYGGCPWGRKEKKSFPAKNFRPQSRAKLRQIRLAAGHNTVPREFQGTIEGARTGDKSGRNGRR